MTQGLPGTDDFSIKDAANPSHYYRLASSALSMKGARVLKDSGGRAIVHMHHKVNHTIFMSCACTKVLVTSGTCLYCGSPVWP